MLAVPNILEISMASEGWSRESIRLVLNSPMVRAVSEESRNKETGYDSNREGKNERDECTDS